MVSAAGEGDKLGGEQLQVVPDAASDLDAVPTER